MTTEGKLSLADLFPGRSFPSELEGDPAFVDEMAQLAPKKEDDSGGGAAGDKGAAGDSGAGAAGDNGSSAADDKGAGAADDKGAGGAADDKGAGAAADEFDIEVSADVVIGDVTLKKEILSKLDEPTLTAIATLKEKFDGAVKEASEVKDAFAKFEEDPVIAERLSRIAAGKAAEQYPAVGITKNTYQAVSKALADKGVSEADAAEILKVVLTEANQDLQFHVGATLKNAALQSGAEQQQAQIDTRGKAVISEIAKMNEKLSDDVVREWCMDPGRKGSAKNGGMNYADLVTMADRLGVDAIYAAIAKAKGLPVAINTADRDKTIAKTAAEKVLNGIGVKRIAKSVRQASAGGSSPASVSGNNSIDPAKIDDPEYIDRLYDSAKTDAEMFEIQSQVSAIRKSRSKGK